RPPQPESATTSRTKALADRISSLLLRSDADTRSQRRKPRTSSQPEGFRRDEAEKLQGGGERSPRPRIGPDPASRASIRGKMVERGPASGGPTPRDDDRWPLASGARHQRGGHGGGVPGGARQPG